MKTHEKTYIKHITLRCHSLILFIKSEQFQHQGVLSVSHLLPCFPTHLLPCFPMPVSMGLEYHETMFATKHYPKIWDFPLTEEPQETPCSPSMWYEHPLDEVTLADVWSYEESKELEEDEDEMIDAQQRYHAKCDEVIELKKQLKIAEKQQLHLFTKFDKVRSMIAVKQNKFRMRVQREIKKRINERATRYAAGPRNRRTP